MFISLAPIDYYFFHKKVSPIQFLLRLDRRLEEGALRASLRKTLRHFPLLTGRLELLPNSDLAFVTQADRTVDSVLIAVREVTEELDLGDLNTLLRCIDPALPEPQQPLLKITLNQGRRQSFLGLSMSHVAGDGYSFFYFLDAWAKTLRGVRFTPPTLDRKILWQDLATNNRPLTADRILSDTGYMSCQPDAPFPSKLTREVLSFSHDDLAALKREADAESRGLSENDVLTAYLLKRFHCFAPQRDRDVVAARCPLNYRRLIPSVSATYFGNALRDAIAEIHADQLESMSLGKIATKIRRAVAAFDSDAALRSLTCLQQLHHEHGAAGFWGLTDPGLAVVNFTRMKPQSFRFGLAIPLQILNASISFRTINVIPQHDTLEAQFIRSADCLGRSQALEMK